MSRFAGPKDSFGGSREDDKIIVFCKSNLAAFSPYRLF